MNDIIEMASTMGNFTVLEKAFATASLTETLKGEGPITVFAPNDEAFEDLPAGVVDALLADLPRLASILAYHVVEGRVMTADLRALDGKSIDTVNGADIDIASRDRIVLNGASTLGQSDIECSNGVMHVIDVVLLPA